MIFSRCYANQRPHQMSRQIGGRAPAPPLPEPPPNAGAATGLPSFLPRLTPPSGGSPPLHLRAWQMQSLHLTCTPASKGSTLHCIWRRSTTREAIRVIAIVPQFYYHRNPSNHRKNNNVTYYCYHRNPSNHRKNNNVTYYCYYRNLSNHRNNNNVTTIT